MSKWTAPVTVSDANGEASFVALVAGPTFMTVHGSYGIVSVLTIDQHGETTTFERQAQSFIGQPLRVWRKWAKAHPYRVQAGWAESISGRRGIRKGPTPTSSLQP